MGRFAPSPSGPLHFGSLMAALGSYLDARSKKGRWLVRIDDLDTPRTVAGSEEAILASLSTHGLTWDAPLSWQSKHQENYRQALRILAQRELLFFCNCSRRSLQKQPIYPGTCRARVCTLKDLNDHLGQNGERSYAIRLRCTEQQGGLANHRVTDELQSSEAINDQAAKGDYVVFRRDGLVSYQLAVVVDDALTGVNRVVRGADLLSTTVRQEQLHARLETSAPAWLHLPVLLNSRATKLSKQAQALAIDDAKPSQNLDIALQLLGQCPPHNCQHMPVDQLIEWATENWKPDQLPATETFSTFFGW